ncbi:MAG TPA: heme exporter protein CcmB [Anaerolineaceae bacterium]|nr:heme exporter protein CcmB [Anaerolineaceae bacterium]HPN53170.1 heme exporter protein CcmB [Anaerolineaceae bacterium]
MTFIKDTLTIAAKDLSAEWRGREMLPAGVIFALLIILVFSFALETQVALRPDAAAGVFWAALTFMGVLSFNRSLAAEREAAGMDGLLLAPVSRTAIYLGKLLASLALLLVGAAVLLPIYAALYNLNIFKPGFALTLLLGLLGFTAPGTLLAAMSNQARTRDLLLPLLLLPVTMPVLIGAVEASRIFLAGGAWNEAAPWLTLLACSDVIFMAAGLLIVDQVLEE